MMPRSRMLFAVAVLLFLPWRAGAECRGVLVRDTVCTTYHSDGSTVCHSNYQYYEYCTYGGGGGGGTTGGGSSGSYYDDNANGRIDQWRAVVATNDPCANNFDENDRLGTVHGGDNSVRTSHSGVDLQANLGDGVFPFMDGTVEAVGDAGDSCGYRVRIKNIDGKFASYCHMELGSSTLTVGLRVYAGYTRLGGVDSTGSSTGDHLHITVRDANGNVSGSYYDYADSRPSSTQLNNGGC